MVFPVPSRDVTNQTLPSRELLIYSRSGRVWLVTSLPGTGKTITFFTVYTVHTLLLKPWALYTDLYIVYTPVNLPNGWLGFG